MYHVPEKELYAQRRCSPQVSMSQSSQNSEECTSIYFQVSRHTDHTDT